MDKLNSALCIGVEFSGSKFWKSKDNLQEFTRKCKLSPKTIYKIYCAIRYELWIQPHEKLIKKFCIVRNFKNGGIKYDWGRICKFYKYLDEILQLEKDGLVKLAWFLFRGISLEQLKSMPALWRHLVHTSDNRCRLIANHPLSNHTGIDFRNYSKIFPHMFPSTLLNAEMSIPQYTLQFVQMLKNSKITYKSVVLDTTNKYYIYWRDYIYMYKKLYPNSKIKLPKTFEQTKLWHDRLTVKINQQKYSKDPLTFDIEVQELNGWTITPLISAYDLQMEGKKMHHCIASYQDRIKKGEYYAVNVEKEDVKYTIGFCLQQHRWRKDVRVALQDQTQGICNADTREQDTEDLNKIYIKCIEKLSEERVHGISNGAIHNSNDERENDSVQPLPAP